MEIKYIKPSNSYRSVKDISGIRFGRLIVMRFSHIVSGRGSFWLCVCDCGKENTVSRNALMRKGIRSCGCLNKDRTIETHVLPDGLGCFNRIYNQYKQASKAKQRSFELTREEFKLLVDGHCHYCGCKPSNIMKSRTNADDYIYNGIDRKDNDIGYVLYNCVTACSICNQAKHDFSYEEFMNWIKTLISFRNN